MSGLEALLSTTLGKLLATAAISMVPVLELRGGIPFGRALGLGPWEALFAAVLGNMFPIPFLIVYVRRVFQWLRKRIPRLGALVDRLENKAHLKGETVAKYGPLGLFILVAIPLPGTGGWTGALVAALLNLRLLRALPTIFLGVLTAGFIMTFLTHAVTMIA